MKHTKNLLQDYFDADLFCLEVFYTSHETGPKKRFPRKWALLNCKVQQFIFFNS